VVKKRISTAEVNASNHFSELSEKLFDFNHPLVVLCRAISVIGGGLGYGWSLYGSVGSVVGATVGIVAFYLTQKYWR
jgi:hypothetical protein